MIQQEQHNLNSVRQQPQEDDTIDIKKIFFLLIRNWFWFLLSVFITGAAAYAYNRYTTPVYEVSSTILFEEGQGKSSPLSALAGGGEGMGNVFMGLGGMNSMLNIYNQMV